MDNYLKRKSAILKEFSTSINQKDRELLANHLLNKVIPNLNQDIFKTLQSMGMLDAYEDMRNEVSKQSTPFKEAIAKDFFKLCIVEKNYRHGLYLHAEEKNYHGIAEALEIVDPLELKAWLDNLLEQTRQQDFKSIIAKHAYARDFQQSETDILNEGRKLIENDKHLEVYKLDVELLHLDIENDLWDVISLLARYRVETVAEFYPKILDPHGRFLIYLILSRRNDRFKLGLSYINSAESSLVWLGLKICLKFLKEIEELYASSDIDHHKRKNEIITRRKTKLENGYACVWNELFATGRVQNFSDFELMLKHFDIGKKSMQRYKITDLENVDYPVFIESSIQWMLNNPESINDLPKITSTYDIDLKLHWMGQFLSLNNEVTPLVDEKINSYLDFFLEQIRNKDHRYWFQITDNHHANYVNSWISFFSGVLKHKSWGNIWTAVEIELSKIKLNETSIWKRPDFQYATDDVLTFCAIIFSFSCRNSNTSNLSKLSDILLTLKNVTISTHTTRGNWDILLRFLISHQDEILVINFVDNTILKDGVPPDVVSLIPDEMLQNNHGLLLRAKEQIASYKNFFSKEFERCKDRLEDKGML